MSGGVIKEYPMEKKLKVVEDWLELGELKSVAAMHGIHYQTIKQWKTTPWWKEFEDEILAQRRIGTQNKIASIVGTGLEVVEERLKNGEFFYDGKSGEVKRRPVSLRDAATATSGLMARQSILEKQNSLHNNREQTKTIQEQLSFLAGEFAKFNRHRKADAEDVEFKELSNALHEERPAGI